MALTIKRVKFYKLFLFLGTASKRVPSADDDFHSASNSLDVCSANIAALELAITEKN